MRQKTEPEYCLMVEGGEIEFCDDEELGEILADVFSADPTVITNAWVRGPGAAVFIKTNAPIADMKAALEAKGYSLTDYWRYLPGENWITAQLRRNDCASFEISRINEQDLRMALQEAQDPRARLANYLSIMAYGFEMNVGDRIGLNDMEDALSLLGWQRDEAVLTHSELLEFWSGCPLSLDDLDPAKMAKVTVRFSAHIPGTNEYVEINPDNVTREWDMPVAALPKGFDPGNKDHLDCLVSNDFTPPEVRALSQHILCDFSVAHPATN